MNLLSRARFILPLACGLLFISACGEPDRGEYRDQAAEKVCKEALRCENLGPDRLYSDYDECIIKERARFNDLWPENRCGGGRINEDRYQTCENRASNFGCTGNDRILNADRAALLQHCHADRVCID